METTPQTHLGNVPSNSSENSRGAASTFILQRSLNHTLSGSTGQRNGLQDNISYWPMTFEITDNKTEILSLKNPGTLKVGNEVAIPRVNQEKWVTVFGLTENNLESALENLKGFGEIVQFLQPDQGNYMHVEFKNAKDASHLLSKSYIEVSNSSFIGFKMPPEKM